MLRHVGKTTPLAVVFAGVCLGILVVHRDITPLVFTGVLVLALTGPQRFVHLLTGIVTGVVALCLAPGWADVPEGRHLVEGVVENAGFSRGTYRITLEGVSVDHRKVRGCALITVYEHVAAIDPGCRIRAYMTVRPPRTYGNSGEFDYQEYLLTQGITLAGVVKDFETIEVIGSPSSPGFRNRVVSRLDAFARPESEVLKAVLAGDRSGLVYSLTDGFASLGIAHLMAISGLHMGIIMFLGYTALFGVLRLIPPLSLRCDAPFVAKTGGLMAALGYTLFVGATIPTLRAAIMAGCVIGSIAFVRKANLLESLALSGIIIVFLWPASLYSASFLLSFSAVLGIIAVCSRLESYPKWILLFGIPVGATVFTLPVVMYVFGFVSPMSIPANLLLVPFFSFVIMPAGLLGLAASLLCESVSTQLFCLCMDGIGVILKSGELFGSLKPVATPWLFWVFLTYAGLIAGFFAGRSRTRAILIAVSCILIVSIPIARQVSRSVQPLSFDFISVGQGDSTLITKGSYAMLIDAGGSYSGFDTGRFIVGPHLLERGITSLDLVVITHPHPDHIGGIPFILQRFPVGEVWTNVSSYGSAGFQDMIRITREKSLPLKTVGLGDTYEHGGLRISVLNPQLPLEDRMDSMDQNIHSIVLKVCDETMGGLFMGDADGLGEIRTSRLDRDISADVLKVAHHGSRRSCLNMLLDRVNPRIAVISCGEKNPYNLPSRDAIKRLENRGIRVYRTDMHGEITIAPANMVLGVKSGRVHADN